jgi:hypothetical protein
MVAVAIGGAAVLGAAATTVGAGKAAKATTKSANMSVAEQRRQDDLNRSENAPFLETGRNALDKLAGLYGVQRQGATAPPTSPDGTPLAYGGFETSPGYAFRRDEGLKAVERGAAARGLLRSGAAVKATDRFAEGLASSEYESFASHLAQLAGVGQQAVSQNAASGSNAANNISVAYNTAGNARASAYATAGAAVNNGLTNLASAYLFQKGGGFNVPKLPAVPGFKIPLHRREVIQHLPGSARPILLPPRRHRASRKPSQCRQARHYRQRLAPLWPPTRPSARHTQPFRKRHRNPGWMRTKACCPS